jgi:hypothetical protein
MGPTVLRSYQDVAILAAAPDAPGGRWMTWLTDHASRFLLLCEALESTREDTALTAFERPIRERGLPLAISSDNGVPFASPRRRTARRRDPRSPRRGPDHSPGRRLSPVAIEPCAASRVACPDSATPAKTHVPRRHCAYAPRICASRATASPRLSARSASPARTVAAQQQLPDAPAA